MTDGPSLGLPDRSVREMDCRKQPELGFPAARAWTARMLGPKVPHSPAFGLSSHARAEAKLRTTGCEGLLTEEGNHELLPKNSWYRTAG